MKMNKSKDDVIVQTLAIHRRTNKKNFMMSTYKLWKVVGGSWSTIKIHCYELLADKKIKRKIIKPEIGEGKTEFWYVTLKYTDKELKER